MQRRLRHELPDPAVGRKTVQDHQPSARHGHIAQAVPRLVRPLGALRIGHVDQQHLVEVQHGVLQHHGPLNHTNPEIQVLVHGLRFRSLFFQVGKPGKLRGEIDLREPAALIRSMIRRVQRISSWVRCGVGCPSA